MARAYMIRNGLVLRGINTNEDQRYRLLGMTRETVRYAVIVSFAHVCFTQGVPSHRAR